jgi:hypothetical protein
MAGAVAIRAASRPRPKFLQFSVSASRLISDTFWILFDPLLKRLLFSYREVLRQIRAQAMSSATGPPHSHDDYEETAYGLSGVLTVTVEGKHSWLAPDRQPAFPAEPCIVSATTPRRTQRCCASSRRRLLGRSTSARLGRSSSRGWRPARPRKDG